MKTFYILETDGTMSQREPTADKWYCGMTIQANGDAIGGSMGQYTKESDGYGVFLDEFDSGAWSEVNMNGYDYLAEQA